MHAAIHSLARPPGHELRYAEGQSDRLPALAADLVRLKVDAILTLSNQETLAAKQATSSIPIIMLLSTAPVEAGLVAGLVGFTTAIGIHPIVGYVSFVHLAPAYAGALAFLVGMRLLYRPMCRVDQGGDRFPDA